MSKFHIRFSCLLGLIFFVTTLQILAQNPDDPLSGIWTGEWGPNPNHRMPVVVELKWDGKTLKGTVNRGPKAVKLDRTSFDPKTGVVHLEADSVLMDPKSKKGRKIHYTIEGKLENGVLFGTWNHDNVRGDFNLIKK